MSSISIIGLYNYDNTIFDDFNLPLTMDKDTMINTILSNLGELEIVYPDTNWIKETIKYWSKANLNNWSMLSHALNTEYELSGRSEKETHTETRDLTAEGNGTSKGNTDTKQAAFNSSSLVNVRGDNSEVKSSSINTDSGTIVHDYVRKYYGVVGNLTSAQIMEAEIEFRKKYNIYDIIMMDFKERFCLMIY